MNYNSIRLNALVGLQKNSIEFNKKIFKNKQHQEAFWITYSFSSVTTKNYILLIFNLNIFLNIIMIIIINNIINKIYKILIYKSLIYYT